MTNKNLKKENEIFFSIVKVAVIGFAAYGIYNLLRQIREKDKNEVKVKEVFKEIQEGSIIKRIRLTTKEYYLQRS